MNDLPPKPHSPDITPEQRSDVGTSVRELLGYAKNPTTQGKTMKFQVPVVGTENHLLVEGVHHLMLEHVENAKLPEGTLDVTSLVAQTTGDTKEMYVLMDSKKGEWLSATCENDKNFFKLEPMDGFGAERLMELLVAAQAEFRPPHDPVPGN